MQTTFPFTYDTKGVSLPNLITIVPSSNPIATQLDSWAAVIDQTRFNPYYNWVICLYVVESQTFTISSSLPVMIKGNSGWNRTEDILSVCPPCWSKV